MKSNLKNERYILVTKNCSFKHILFAIADEFNAKRPYIKITPFLRELAWRIALVKSFFSRKPAFISKEAIRASNRVTRYSNKKIISHIHYNFTPIEEVIKKACKYFDD